MNKYGFDNFLFEKLDESDDINELNEKEMFWIKYYNSNNKKYGYNLDSGGKSGGKKSDETKRKIGLTTIKKWENKETAKKMLDGLRKGTETVKNNKKRYPFTCPLCGTVIYLQKYQLKDRKYCSNNCTAKSNSWEKGLKNAIKSIKGSSENRRKQMYYDIRKWVINNKEIVDNCPKNKIEKTLKSMMDMIKDKYEISDMRSIFLCFDNVKNKKELLDELQIISKENIC